MKVCFTFKVDKLTRINLLLRIHYIFENTVALCDLNDLTICRRCFTLVFYLKLHSLCSVSKGPLCSRTGFAIFVIWTWAGFDPTCVSPINWFETVMPLVTAFG